MLVAVLLPLIMRPMMSMWSSLQPLPRRLQSEDAVNQSHVAIHRVGGNANLLLLLLLLLPYIRCHPASAIVVIGADGGSIHESRLWRIFLLDDAWGGGGLGGGGGGQNSHVPRPVPPRPAPPRPAPPRPALPDFLGLFFRTDFIISAGGNAFLPVAGLGRQNWNSPPETTPFSGELVGLCNDREVGTGRVVIGTRVRISRWEMMGPFSAQGRPDCSTTADRVRLKPLYLLSFLFYVIIMYCPGSIVCILRPPPSPAPLLLKQCRHRHRGARRRRRRHHRIRHHHPALPILNNDTIIGITLTIARMTICRHRGGRRGRRFRRRRKRQRQRRRQFQLRPPAPVPPIPKNRNSPRGNIKRGRSNSNPRPIRTTRHPPPRP